MLVRVYTADTGGCGHYRLIFPGRVLQDHGYDVEIVTLEDEGLDSFKTFQIDDRYRSKQTGKEFSIPRVVGVVKPDCDVVVIQRPLQRRLVECIPFLQAHGVAVVVELDDDFEAIPVRNIAWRQTNPALSPERNHRWLRLACEMADLVTCSTPTLARKYGGYVLPNYVPERYQQIRPGREPGLPTVGWTGHVATHPDDLQVSGTAVKRLLAEGLARFAVVGDGKYVPYAMGLGPMDAPASGFVPIDVYPEYMAQFDVGIVPLELNPFNQAKSWLKGLEFASLGVPFVASPTKEYESLTSMGAGRLATRPRHWYSALHSLVANPLIRAEAAERGAHAVRSLTYENNAERWWQAWEIAWAKRRAAIHV